MRERGGEREREREREIKIRSPRKEKKLTEREGGREGVRERREKWVVGEINTLKWHFISNTADTPLAPGA